MLKTPAIIVFSALVLLACRRTRTTPPEAPAGTIADPRPRVAEGPSFRRDIAPLLAATCAGIDGCHGPDATDRVNIDLREATSFRTLVGRPSELRPNALLIDPGHPERSFLVDKVRHRQVKGEGKPMPLDPQTGNVLVPSPIADFVERKLIPWIATGALDN